MFFENIFIISHLSIVRFYVIFFFPPLPPPVPLTIVCGQCCVPDLNYDLVRLVSRAGPQPQSYKANMVSHDIWGQCGGRTSTAIMWIQCGAPDLDREMVRKKNVTKTVRSFVRMNVTQNTKDLSERMSERVSDRTSERMPTKCQKECQNIRKYVCQKVWGSLEVK